MMKKPQLAKLVEEAEDSDLESDKEGILENTTESSDKENTEHTDKSSAADATTDSQTKTKPLTTTTRTNIFDEEDNDPAPKIRGLGGRGLPGGGGGVLGRINLKAKPVVGKGKTLAEFSPLKKDRRAASILE